MKRMISLIAALTLALPLGALKAPAFAATAAEKIKVACVGDSITQGLGNTPYPTRLQNLLGEKYEVRNFGLYGTTACFNTGRLYTSCEDSCYQKSLEYKPDVVIIMLGTNDGNESGIKNAREHFTDDLTAIINSYLALEKKPEVWLLTSPYAYLPSNAPVNSDIAPMQRELAEKLSLPLLDMHTLTADMPQMFQDGLHPSESGYFFLALNIYEKIFGGRVGSVTVRTTPNADIMLNACSVKADKNGEAQLRMAAGKQLLTVTSRDYEPVYAEVDIPGDCVIECELTQSINVSLSASPVTNGSAENAKQAIDGDLTTGWQSDARNQGLYFGIDLNKNRTFSRVTVCWETATRATPQESGYRIEFSTDGETWRNVDNPVYTFGDGMYPTAMDVVTFETVAARYIRIVMDSFTSDKYAPKIYEFAVYAAAESGTQIKVSPADAPLGPVDPDGGEDDGEKPSPIKKWLPLAALAGALAVGLSVIAVVSQKKKSKRK